MLKPHPRESVDHWICLGDLPEDPGATALLLLETPPTLTTEESVREPRATFCQPVAAGNPLAVDLEGFVREACGRLVCGDRRNFQWMGRTVSVEAPPDAVVVPMALVFLVFCLCLTLGLPRPLLVAAAVQSAALPDVYWFIALKFWADRVFNAAKNHQCLPMWLGIEKDGHWRGGVYDVMYGIQQCPVWLDQEDVIGPCGAPAGVRHNWCDRHFSERIRYREPRNRWELAQRQYRSCI